MSEPLGATDERDEVEAVNESFYQALEAGDLDRVGELWLDDPDTVCVHPGALPVRGTSAINRSWALIMANSPYIQFILTDVEVNLFGEVAAVTCTENVLTAYELGDAGAFDGGKAVATNLFLRTEEGWRLWVRHASPVLSPEHHEDD